MRNHLLVLLLYLPAFCFSQTNINAVICNRAKAPLPYVNIVSLNHQTGTVTDANGMFELNKLGANDTLKISAIGYISKLLPVKNLTPGDTLFLEKRVHELNTVTIRDYRQNVQLGFEGYPNNASFNFTPGGEVGLYIENTRKQEALIRSVSFRIKTKQACSSIRVRLMNVDIKNRLPGEDLLTENVIIGPADLKKDNRVDIEKYHLLLPNEGVFVVLEWVSAEGNCGKNVYTALAANQSIPNNLVWLNFRDKHWAHSNTPRLPNNNYMTPNIGLNVAY